MNRRTLLRTCGAVSGTGLALAAAASNGRLVAMAADDWCAQDPLITIVTAAGNVLDVHITNYVQGTAHALQLDKATISWKAKHVARLSSTDVYVSVVIPADDIGHFKTKTVASSGLDGTGTVYATDTGHGSSTMVLYFRMNGVA